MKRQSLLSCIAVALAIGVVTSAIAQPVVPQGAPAVSTPAATTAPAPPPDQVVLTDGTVPSKILDSADSQLQQLSVGLRRTSLDDTNLQALRSQIDPIQTSLFDLISRLSPRLDAINARLAQLGPKPDDKAPPEATSVTADREAQQKLFNETDQIFKRARLLSVQAGQMSDGIQSRRRAAFLNDLFERSDGIFSRSLWSNALADAPHEITAITLVAGDFVSRTRSNLMGWRWPAFLVLLLVLLFAAFPLSRMARWILSREPSVTDPDALRKALGACWVALVASAVPIVVTMLVLLLCDAFDLFSSRLAPLERVIAQAVTGVALMAALARAILAPDHPNWRLVSVPGGAAERLTRLLVALAVLVSLMRVVEVLHDVIVSSVATTIVVQGLGALAAALLLAGTLYGLPDEAADDDCLGPRVDQRRDWFGLIRVSGWVVAIVVIVSVIAGYVAFGAFIIDQVAWVLVVCLAAYLALVLTVRVLGAQFEPDALVGRTLVRSVGIRRERLGQIGILLTGAVRIAIFCVAALLIVAPWGIQSDDLSGTLRTAYFGFSVGGVTISPSSLVTASVLFCLALAAARGFQSWLGDKFLPTTMLDNGLRNSIRTSVGYIGVILALSLALAQLGLSFDKIAIVAGALSVGIGFGLQSIVNNFVSGLILLWERAIRVGDWVVVGSEQGFVRRINVRSTEIETFDRAMMIVPNSNLVTGIVKNWVRSDRIGRIKIAVTVQNGSDPERVRDTLIELAKSEELVTRLPAPQVIFTAIEASGLSFELICFVADVETSQRAKSDLHFAIFKRFAEEKIAIAPPAPPPTSIAFAPETQAAIMDTLRRGVE